MHPLFFGVKRVHWALVKQQAAVFQDEDVCTTPARFDLLRVVFVHRYGIARWKLVRLLGVSGPVVSRMLKALEALGLLDRTRADHDRRIVVVTLTAEGRGIVRRGLENNVMAFEREAVRCFTTGDGRRERREEELRELSLFLHRARVVLEDDAPFPHPWRYDNLVREERAVMLVDEPPLYALSA